MSGVGSMNNLNKMIHNKIQHSIDILKLIGAVILIGIIIIATGLYIAIINKSILWPGSNMIFINNDNYKKNEGDKK